jgi:membrane protein DedA with SNARE-associated domain
MVPELAIPYLAELSYLAIPIVLFLGSSGLIPLPEEVILLIIGYAAYTDVLHLWPAIGIAVLGVVVSDVIHFYCATHGHGILKRLLHGKTVKRVQRSVERHGWWTVFIARFIPVMRILTPWVAGGAGMKFRTFLSANVLGALIQTPIIIWIGHRLGPQVGKGIVFIEKIDVFLPWTLLLIFVSGAAYVFLHRKQLRQRRRAQ